VKKYLSKMLPLPFCNHRRFFQLVQVPSRMLRQSKQLIWQSFIEKTAQVMIQVIVVGSFP